MIPAITSVRTLVPCSESLKKLSSIPERPVAGRVVLCHPCCPSFSRRALAARTGPACHAASVLHDLRRHEGRDDLRAACPAARPRRSGRRARRGIDRVPPRAASAGTTRAWCASRSCRHRPRRRAPAPRARSGSRARGRGSAPRRPRPARRPPHHLLGQRRQHASRSPAGASRELLRALVDQHRPHRQQRQRRRERPADVAGAEDVAPRAAPRARLGGQRAAAAPASPRSARTTASSVRPPQHWPISGPSGMSSALGGRRRAPASPAPRRSPCTRAGRRRWCRACACAADEHPGAGLARGRAAGALDPRPAPPPPASTRKPVDRAPAGRVTAPPRAAARSPSARARASPARRAAGRSGSRRRWPPPSTAPRAPRRRA